MLFLNGKNKSIIDNQSEKMIDKQLKKEKKISVLNFTQLFNI